MFGNGLAGLNVDAWAASFRQWLDFMLGNDGVLRGPLIAFIGICLVAYAIDVVMSSTSHMFSPGMARQRQQMQASSAAAQGPHGVSVNGIRWSADEEGYFSFTPPSNPNIVLSRYGSYDMTGASIDLGEGGDYTITGDGWSQSYHRRSLAELWRGE